MARVSKTEVISLGQDDNLGSAHFTIVKINHETEEAYVLGFQLDQYELDSYTMWINEVMERHATAD